jgi:CheY-like chemotaxis protein
MTRVLTVEDNPAHLALITSLVSQFGHATIAATDAETGLRLVDEEHPDLVLCDIQLPAQSGYDLVRRLKSDPATHGLPVIAVTAVAKKDEAMQAGFDGFLSKPLSLQRLRAEIERVLPGAGGSDAVVRGKVHGASAWVKTGRPRTGKRILVLDDTEANRELMRVVLDYGGHDVVCARTVADALVTAQSWRPHLILCDTHLDHELGTDLLHAVQNSPDLHQTRFAFTTASRGPGAEHEACQTRACASLRLPMKPDVLLREVGELLAVDDGDNPRR